jgi:O-antigen/teichoic acid export membrane protein
MSTTVDRMLPERPGEAPEQPGRRRSGGILPAGALSAAHRPALSALAGLARQLGPVALGLLVLGLGSFGYLSIAGRSLGPAAFAPVATLWVIFNAAALAFYQPIEQELGRETARRLALGTGSAPVLRRCVVAGAALTSVVGVLLVAFRGPLGTQVFDGRPVLIPLLLVGLVGLFAEYVMRGLFGGNQRFGRYGLQLAIDGALRLAGPVAVLLVSSATTASMAATLVACPLVAAAVTSGRPRRLAAPGPPAAWRTVLPALGTLTGGAVLSQLIVNAAPVAAELLARPGEVARAGVFIAALVLTRIPLFFFGAVQATFLPALARLQALGDRAGFLQRLRGILAVTGGAGALFVLALAAVGPVVLRLLYGPAFGSSRTVLVVLGLGAAVYMLAQGLAQALIALHRYRSPLYAWGIGSAVFFGGLALPFPLETRVSAALLLGAGASAVGMAALLLRALPAPEPLVGHPTGAP